MRIFILTLFILLFGCQAKSPDVEHVPEKEEPVPEKPSVEFVQGAPLQSEMPIASKYRAIVSRTSVLNQETLPEEWTKRLPVELTETAFKEAGLDWSKPIAVVTRFAAHVAVIDDVEKFRTRFNLQEETKKKFGFAKERWDWSSVTPETPFHKLFVHPDKPSHDGWTFYRNSKLGLTISIFEDQYAVFASLDTHHDLFDTETEVHNADLVVQDRQRTFVASVVDEKTLHVESSVAAEPFYVVVKTLTESGRPVFGLQSVGLMMGDKKSREAHREVSKKLDALVAESKENIEAAVTLVLTNSVQPDPGFADTGGAKMLLTIDSLPTFFSDLHAATQKELHVDARAALQKELKKIDKKSMSGMFGTQGFDTGDLGLKGLKGIGGLRGDTMGDAFGAGGLGTRGMGKGGGGTGFGLGGLGTKGIGSGTSGYGSGQGRIGKIGNARSSDPKNDKKGATDGKTDNKK